MERYCPECGSIDIDVSGKKGVEVECLECGWSGGFDDLDTDEDWYEPPMHSDDDWTPPDYGPPGSGAVIVEYTGFEPGLEEPW